MLVNTVFRNPLSVAREMDRLFDSMLSTQPRGAVPAFNGQWTFPPMNIWEDAENLYAEAELPGLKMEDIEVLVTDDELTIRGSRSVDLPEGARALRRERAVGTFERTCTLPAPINTEQVSAQLTNGVLSITLPKAAEAKPRRIAVESSKGLPNES